MNSPVTLHDFVLNLISDADARTAFQLDPDAALHAAGLTDVTPADVHDAIPLVVDYAPARVAGLAAGLPDPPAPAPGATLDGGVAGTVPGTVASTAGTLTGTVDGLTHHTVGTLTGSLDSAHGLTGGLTGGLTHGLDVGHVLDPGAVPGLDAVPG